MTPLLDYSSSKGQQKDQDPIYTWENRRGSINLPIWGSNPLPVCGLGATFLTLHSNKPGPTKGKTSYTKIAKKTH